MSYAETPKWAPYLTRLIEGDGSIYVPVIERTLKGQLLYPSIEISFHFKDFPLAQGIQKYLGNGSLHKKAHAAAYVLTLNSKQGLLHLVSLMNGQLRGPKYPRFKSLIEYLNANDPKLGLVCLPLNFSPLSSNGWLAGFMEADSSFQVRASPSRVAMSWELTQARETKFGHSNYDLMSTIASFVGVNSELTRTDRKHPQYRIRTSTVKSHQILSKYLEKHPMQGSKQLDFKDWATLIPYFESKTHKVNLEVLFQWKEI